LRIKRYVCMISHASNNKYQQRDNQKLKVSLIAGICVCLLYHGNGYHRTPQIPAMRSINYYCYNRITTIIIKYERGKKTHRTRRRRRQMCRRSRGIILLLYAIYYIIYKCSLDTQRTVIKYNANGTTPHDSASTIITTTRRCIICNRHKR